MVELHLHLDGSLSIDDFIYLGKLNHIKLPKNINPIVKVGHDCDSLDSYLKAFELPLSLLQTKESIIYAFSSLMNRLYKIGLIYAEIRFAPFLHTRNGLSQDQVVEAAIKGLKQGLENKTDFDANIILCTMRHLDENTNIETINVANKYKNNKVCGVDLAGSEMIKNIADYRNIFALAKSYQLNITLHAGEARESEEVISAINLGASRIGHGVHLILNDENINLVKKKNITFEFCPTSNIQTRSIVNFESFPIHKFLDENISITLNSDNMTVSDTDIYQEFRLMKKYFALNNDEIYLIVENSIKNSFASDIEKAKLLKILSKRFDSFLTRL